VDKPVRRQTYGYLSSLSLYSCTHCAHHGGMARLSCLGGWLHTEIVYPPKTVTHPGTNRAQRRVTRLIETNALAQSQTANQIKWINCLLRDQTDRPDSADVFFRQGCFAIDYDFATHRCYFFATNLWTEQIPTTATPEPVFYRQVFFHCPISSATKFPSLNSIPNPNVVHITCEFSTSSIYTGWPQSDCISDVPKSFLHDCS